MSYFRKNIDAMAGYTPGEQPGEGDRVVKLNTNENPYSPSPRVLEALRAIDPVRLRKYPDPMANKVRDIIARQFGVGRASVLCGNGGDELLALITRAFVGEGDRMVYPTPTYSLYPVLAEIQGARPVEVPTAEDFSIPAEALAKTRTPLMILCNPNAPTGLAAPIDVIGRIAAKFKGVVVVDEAYVDFASDDAMRLAKERPNVLVLRTLSKAYSLAGLRFGFAVGPADLIAGLVKIKDSYNCDAVAIELAAAALADQAWMRMNVEKIRTERARLAAALGKMGFDAPPSESNFLFARVPGGDGRRWYEGLKSRGILVRYWNGPRLADRLRITVGTPEENGALLAALEQMMEEVPA